MKACKMPNDDANKSLNQCFKRVIWKELIHGNESNFTVAIYAGEVKIRDALKIALLLHSWVLTWAGSMKLADWHRL